MTMIAEKYDTIESIMNTIVSSPITQTLLSTFDIPHDSDQLFSDLIQQLDSINFPASSLDRASLILSGLTYHVDEKDGRGNIEFPPVALFG